MQMTVAMLRIDGPIQSVGQGRDGTHYVRFMTPGGVVNCPLTVAQYQGQGSPAEGEVVSWYVAPTRFADQVSYMGLVPAMDASASKAPDAPAEASSGRNGSR